MPDTKAPAKVSGLAVSGSALLVTLAVVSWWLIDAQAGSFLPTMLGTVLILVVAAGGLMLKQHRALGLGLLLGAVLSVGLFVAAFIALALTVGS